MAVLTEDHPSSESDTGDLIISRLALTGWGQTLQTWSTNGLIYASISSGTITFYRRKKVDGTFATGDRICSGTVSSNPQEAVALSALNSSGITGTVDVSGSSGTCRAYICFADETDVRHYIHELASALDSNSQFEGVARFEGLLKRTMRRLCEKVRNRLSHQLETRNDGTLDILDLRRPGQLRDVLAQMTAALLYQQLGAGNSPMYLEHAKRLEAQADKDFMSIAFEVDTNQDAELDGVSFTRSRRLRRG